MRVSDSNSTELKTNSYYADNHQEKRFVNSMVFRLFMLILLLAALYFPVFLMGNALTEHLKQQQTISNTLSEQWGNEQTIVGPIISIPYVERISKIESQTDSNGVRSSVSKDIFNSKTLVLLPENLRINADIKHKTLTKKELQASVYEADIELTGNFNLEALPKPSAYNSIEWDKAFLAMGVNKNHSVRITSPLRWEGSSSAFRPGTNLPHMLKNGFHAGLEEVVSDAELPQFKIQLKLKGKQRFAFAPMGQQTNATIKSDSSQLIINSDINAASSVRTDDSFEAVWRISNLVRNYPQQWLLEEGSEVLVKPDFYSVLAGVETQQNKAPANEMLFKIKSILPLIIPMLGILFLSILILEFKRNSAARPKFLHYLIASLSVLSIPLILLTIKDLSNFEQAFQIAAGTSLVLTVIYLMSALKSFFKAFYILLIMSSMYGALYIYLQLPEYALFALSAAGLFITVLLMMTSVNIQEDE